MLAGLRNARRPVCLLSASPCAQAACAPSSGQRLGAPAAALGLLARRFASLGVVGVPMRTLSKMERKRGVWMVEKPTPDLGYNDVRVRMTHTAICGTDVHIYKWDSWAEQTIRTGMTFGHEFCGVVDAVGAGVTHFHNGQRVSGEGHLVCGYCRNCRAGRRHLCRSTKGVGVNIDGAFAEYLTLPATNVFPIPIGIGSSVASIFDPLGNAVHTALSFDLVGEDVLVTGAGPIGIMGAALAKHCGAKRVVITDISDDRLDVARRITSITRAVNVGREDLRDVAFNELGLTEGFDVGLEMSGSGPAFRQMLKLMNHGGKVSLLGIPSETVNIDWNDVIFKGLVIKGIYGREMYETWYKMVSVIQSGFDISQVITHEYPIEDYQEAFEVASSGKAGKVILKWPRPKR